MTHPDPGVLRWGALALAPGECAVMAIVNATPDSFFDRGATYALADALARVDRVVDEGARIVDIGGVKAAPGTEVDAAEELRRVLPVVEGARSRHADLVISVDTWRAEVADAVLRAGADVVNDAWGGVDPDIRRVTGELGGGMVCTHAGGVAPRTPPHRVWYDDVVRQVRDDLVGMAEACVAAGIRPDGVVIDPGHDFGKSSRHSLTLTRELDQLAGTGWPVLVALSRKDFVGEVLDLGVDDRLEGTLAATAISAWNGARVFRAHDVPATVRVLEMVEAIRGARDLRVGKRGLA